MCFEFRQLRYALAAAEHQSFAKAGGALDIAPSAVARQIEKLEAALGRKLFERSRSGVRLTRAGERFMPRARRLFDNYEGLARSTRMAADNDSQSLVIGFATSLAAGNLKAHLVEYARTHQSIHLDLREGQRTPLVAALDAGQIDVVVLPGADVIRDLESMLLWSERIYVAVPEHHPLDHDRPIGWTDLGAERLLISGLDPGNDLAQITESQLLYAVHRPTIVRPQVCCETIRGLAAAGLGIGLLHEACIGARHGGLVYRELTQGQAPSQLRFGAYWSATNENPALAPWLLQLETRHPQPHRIARARPRG